MKRLTMLSVLAGLMALLVAVPTEAQLNGSHTLGDYGVQAGTQPQPGLYTALFYYRYNTDTLKNADGKTVRPFPDTPGSIAIHAVAPLLWYVSKFHVLGANYGAQVIFPWANGSIEAPAFELPGKIDTGFGDMLFRPLDLGWHTKRADVDAGFQFYAPTGRYEPGASDNLGKGMWTYEPFGGATVYFDEKRSLSLATTAFWEIHGNKQDSDVKVGQILSLEGGLGKSFLGGGLVVGAAYYAQWKLTSDKLGGFVLPGGAAVEPGFPDKHRVFAFGPDVIMPVATKKKLYSLVNVRYFWETGARSKTQGNTLTVTATFPIPSVKLK